MTDNERTPLLAQENEGGPSRETEPLLSGRQERETDHDTHAQADSSPSLSKRLAKIRSRLRWPSIIAIATLGALIIAVIVLGFVAPPAVKQYVESAAVLEPTSLSLESLTADGIRARVHAKFRLDASRVADDNARRIGRLVTSVMRQLDAEGTKVDLRLPKYQNALLGTAVVPPLSLDLVDGHDNELDFVTDVIPGDAEIVRNIVNEWLGGRLDQLTLTGAAALRLKSGILPLGTHDVVESMVLQAKEIPSMPDYKIQNLVLYDAPVGHKGKMGVGANVSVTIHNDYAIGLDVPPLGLEVLVPNCNPAEPNIEVASASTSVVHVRPKADVVVDARGIVREIPESLTRPCADTRLSPLDSLVDRYLHGKNAQVFVRGKVPEDSDLPPWAGAILESITVPFEFTGRTFDSLIRNFSLTDVDFKLPSPIANPNDPDGKPQVSGTVRVLAALPAELHVDVGVDSLRAVGDLIYDNRKFGELHLERWQKANSTINSGTGDAEDTITIVSRVENAPIDIIDGDIFSEVMQKLLFGDDDIILDVRATVDIRIATVLGKLVLKGIPAQGKIPVKHVPGDSLSALEPQFGDLRLVNSSATSMNLRAVVNLTNPTAYTAVIPFLSVHVMKQGYVIGEAVVRDLDLGLGRNSNISVSATWDPLALGHEYGRRVGRRLLSDYLSGRNTSVEVMTHRGSVPAVPIVGEALSVFNLTLSPPQLKLPGKGDDDDGPGGFIRDATFHILSSTATFTLASPLHHDTVHIQAINATAFYNHTEPVGQIVHDEPFDAPPGLSQSPPLPVRWSAGRNGLGKLKEALGGSLKLDAVADVTVRLGRWTEKIRYTGHGIGARVRLL
ncbi:hypothetical protein CDD83_10743 [Cordyceps sp. RAO-2017]|nr:hypothetical protein CDD83_10743 [Cordyceps sp. RAO-2017]